ncbi:MAG: hypothetical protein MI744_10470 [Pseudomonadales bacterium]|nr:hypothetical protein [Pseudomonadales bacterium]
MQQAASWPLSTGSSFGRSFPLPTPEYVDFWASWPDPWFDQAIADAATRGIWEGLLEVFGRLNNSVALSLSSRKMMTGISSTSGDGFHGRMATRRIGHDVMPALTKEPFNMVSQPDDTGVAVVARVPN